MASVAIGYIQSNGGYYKISDGSGPYHIDSSGVATLRGSLPTFVNQAETTTLAAAFTTPPATRRLKTMDWAIRTLKASGAWAKLTGFWHVGNDQQSSLINWVSPGTHDLVIVGSPTFAANDHFAPVASAYLHPQIALNALNPASVSMGVYLRTTNSAGTGNSASDVGALDASGNGLSFCARASSGLATGRVGSANYATFGATADWSEDRGMKAINRTDANNAQSWNGPVRRDNPALASAVMSNIDITFLAINNNGAFTVSNRQQSGWFIGAGMTDAQMRCIINVMQQIDWEFLYGEFDTYEAGYAPQTPTYDFTICGANSGAMVAAYQLKRMGASVCLLGGWRERQPGGMPAVGGLGQTDNLTTNNLGGLTGWIFTQLQSIQGKTSSDFTFEPRYFDRVLRGLFDPRITNGLDIPIYWSNGVTAIVPNGDGTVSIQTADGRTIKTKRWLDATYEGDGAKARGITMRLGREAASEFTEGSLAGYRGNVTTDGATNHQPKNHAGTAVNVDPYNTPGSSASGVLQSLQGTLAGTIGAADALVQAYNFRMTMTNNQLNRVPLSTSPQDDFDPANFEGLLRWLALDATIAMSDIFLINTVSTTCIDLNANGAFSSDLFGASWAYPGASYTAREPIHKRHWKHVLNTFYVLQYYADPSNRVPSALRTEALTYGLHMLHYSRPHPNDDFQMVPQMYVREAYRLDNDFPLLHAGDMTRPDASTPRSTNIAALGMYRLDSHSVGAYADPNSGTPRIWMEGNFESAAGGVDLLTPLPIEIMLPRKTEAPEGMVSFAVAASHVADGGVRLEMSFMALSQAAAVALYQSLANAQAVQDIDMSAWRTTLLASASLSGETAPHVPQTN